MSQVIIEYIESLIDEVNLPTVITIVDGVYHIEVTQDLKHSSVKYANMVWNPDKEITSIKVILKRYLRKFNFKITVKYINYPKNFCTNTLRSVYEVKSRA